MKKVAVAILLVAVVGVGSAGAETLKPKAYISYSDGVGGYNAPYYDATHIGHASGATINFDAAHDVPYSNPPSPGIKVFSESADGVELGSHRAVGVLVGSVFLF